MLKGCDTPGRLSPILYKGDNFCDILFIFSDKQFPSEKGSTLKGKNLLPMGANSFLLE